MSSSGRLLAGVDELKSEGGSRGIRSGDFDLFLQYIFQKIFKPLKSCLENLENIPSDKCLKASISSLFLSHFYNRYPLICDIVC